MIIKITCNAIIEITRNPGPRILPFCHSEWGAVSDLGGSFAERGFKIGHRHCGTTTRSIKTALFNCLFSHGFLVWAEILAENEKYLLKFLVDKFFAWDEPNLQNSC